MSYTSPFSALFSNLLYHYITAFKHMNIFLNCIPYGFYIYKNSKERYTEYRMKEKRKDSLCIILG